MGIVDLLGNFSSEDEENYDGNESRLDIDGLIKIGSFIGSSVGSLINKIGSADADGDGDVDEQDAAILFEYSKFMVSLWGHAAMADGKLEESELDAVSELMDAVVFENILTEDILELLGEKKKSIKKKLSEFFDSPMSMKKIAAFAEEFEVEEEFYEQACSICSSDGDLGSDEREFLDELSERLDLSKFDKRNIERKYIE